MKRLTTPEETNLVRRLYPTGNHFVSLPVISGADASVDRVGVLSMGMASLIEFGGRQAELGAETLPPIEPFLRPFVAVGDRKVSPMGRITWRRLWDWIPAFEWRDPDTGITLEGAIFAPVRRDEEGLQSHKGFVYLLKTGPATTGPARTGLAKTGPARTGLAKTGPAKIEPAGAGTSVRIGLELAWGDLIQTVYTSRRIPAGFTVRRDRWTGGPVLEPRSGAGAGPAALAVSFSVPPEDVEWSSRIEPGGLVRLEMAARPERALAGAGGPPHEALAAAFYFGCSREGDGARTVAVDLSRQGWERLLAETGEALRGLHRRVRRPGDPGVSGVTLATEGEADVLEERLNLNLLFNYFFAAGRTIDTEELVLVTSRSPLYYVSAAFWARDALLWSLPGLALTDPALAEEALGLAFDRYFKHAGIHSLYLDGTLLYPGFELDELAAYPVALQGYAAMTGDTGIVDRRGLVPKVRRLLGLLEARACPKPGVHLYSTFLLPSDDPATYPYVTYDNVLAWRALLCAAELLRPAGLESEAAALSAKAAAVRDSIYEHCVVAGPRGKMFAWSVNLAGGTEIGDEPPGSLELLTYYGFCPRDDEIWRNTVDWLHSRDNPYRYTGVPFPGLGCPHAKHPFVMSLFNALLGGLPERAEEATKVLVGAPLDTGLACESFDRRTGEVKTGAAFATCAGFLGFAIDRVLGSGSGNTGTDLGLWNRQAGQTSSRGGPV